MKYIDNHKSLWKDMKLRTGNQLKKIKLLTT